MISQNGFGTIRTRYRETLMHNVQVGHAAIPAIGFGTYGMSAAEIYRMIPAALHAGFRHIDTAQI
ncbi:hypothetical protein BCY88_27805 [Paraburkholderia fungorum]|uniref:NADP-dependent oxidoreductase domain-containing protein n=1 Tax=Paraburkholderia fungorum TaxID=134537 RepID=A0A3R7ESI4_9BURK|nr:hypothetical protein BCY88_27805 [Paraburkholderia fungorum]